MSYKTVSFPKVVTDHKSHTAPSMGFTEEIWTIDHFEHRMSVPLVELQDREPEEIQEILTKKVRDDFMEWIDNNPHFFDVQYEYDITTGQYTVGTRAKIMRRNK